MFRWHICLYLNIDLDSLKSENKARLSSVTGAALSQLSYQSHMRAVVCALAFTCSVHVRKRKSVWIHKTLPRLKVSWSVNVVSLVIATSNIQLCKLLSEMFRDLHMLVATCAKHNKTNKEKKNVQKSEAIFKSHNYSTTPKWNTHCFNDWSNDGYQWIIWESNTRSFRVGRLLRK